MRFRGRRDDLERRLRAERPQPADDFVSRLAKRMTTEPMPQRTGWRVALAGGLTASLVLAFALTGGISYAASAVKGGTTAVTSLVTGQDKPPKPDKPGKPEQGNNGNSGGSTDTESTAQGGGQSEDKVTICHVPPGNPDNPQTITIGASAVDAHFAEHPDDSLGPCQDDPSPPDDQYNEKVLICHIPPGRPENAHTIRVSENAVPAHLAHGDTEGPCPGDED